MQDFQPAAVGLDPVSSLVQGGTAGDTQMMLTRLIDFLKGRGITALMTNLTSGGEDRDETTVGISSLVDTWLLLAAGDQIVAVPTLVQKLPEPLRKIVGDLRDTERALVGLQLRPAKARL